MAFLHRADFLCEAKHARSVTNKSGMTWRDGGVRWTRSGLLRTSWTELDLRSTEQYHDRPLKRKVEIKHITKDGAGATFINPPESDKDLLGFYLLPDK